MHSNSLYIFESVVLLYDDIENANIGGELDKEELDLMVNYFCGFHLSDVLQQYSILDISHILLYDNENMSLYT